MRVRRLGSTRLGCAVVLLALWTSLGWLFIYSTVLLNRRRVLRFRCSSRSRSILYPTGFIVYLNFKPLEFDVNGCRTVRGWPGPCWTSPRLQLRSANCLKSAVGLVFVSCMRCFFRRASRAHRMQVETAVKHYAKLNRSVAESEPKLIVRGICVYFKQARMI